MNSLHVIYFRDKSNNRFLSMEPAEGSTFVNQKVEVSIFNKNVEKYLTGKDSWHGEEHFFGSCQEPNPDKVFFGPPDVLDSIVENTQLRISAGGLTWEGTLPEIKDWKDDLLPERKLWIDQQPEEINPIESVPVEPEIEKKPIEDTKSPVVKKPPKNFSKRKLLPLVIGVLLLAGLFYFLFGLDSLFHETPPDQVETSQCPSNSAESKTILLVDGTDTIPNKYKQQIGNLCLNKFVEAVPINGLLELRLIRENKPGGEILFSNCDSDDTNWRGGYYDALENAMNLDFTPSESHKKPLLETIQAIAEEHFTEHEIPKKLVIVSDMIENTPAFSHLEGLPFQDRFDESDAKKKFQTKLRNAEIEICLIGRQDSQLNANGLIDFWNSWISESGGILNQ